MNKTDVFFISASMFAAWFCFVFMAPSVIVGAVYIVMANYWVGSAIAQFGINKLHGSDKHLIKELYNLLDKFEELCSSYREFNDALQTKNAFLQARIDALMFEHCPEEMSPSQIANYEAFVKAVSKEREDEINQALKH